MFIWTIRQALHLRSVFLAHDSPRRLALGCALGMLLGLLPKGNLLAVAVSLLILGTRVNLPAAMLSAVAFSFVGVHLDALTHPVGWVLLRHESLQPVWTFLYRLPLVPWTSFNNTVVLGSFTLGMTLLCPAYVLSYCVFRRRQSIRSRERRRVASPGRGDSPVPHPTAPIPEIAARGGLSDVEVHLLSPSQFASVKAHWQDTVAEHSVAPVLDTNPLVVCSFRSADRTGDSSPAPSGNVSASAEEPASPPPARRSA